jgi:hypothetical protein
MPRSCAKRFARALLGVVVLVFVDRDVTRRDARRV